MKRRFLAVDDERLALADMTNALERACPDGEISAFTSPTAALEAVRAGRIRPEVAFLDIQMRGWTGLQLATELRRLQPEIEVVFVTAFSQYALESYALHARGYLLKPVTEQAVREELDVINGTVRSTGDPKVLQVNCFGNFEVFRAGTPLVFPRAKAKELFAYLVCRNGAGCTTREIAAALFEDREYDSSLKNQMETFKSSLMKCLREAGCEDVVVKSHNSIGVVPEKLDCDYYRFLAGEAKALAAFAGEFMGQYSWAEPTAGALTQVTMSSLAENGG
ncbi:MAG: response regulator [Ruminococcaceae bacterium]|nr:response regulator [Oscillospiraceae bacterium]